MGELVRVESDGLVAIVTLDRPAARNALSATLLDQLTAAFDVLRDDSGVRAVVLTGPTRRSARGSASRRSQPGRAGRSAAPPSTRPPRRASR